jgi:tRNA A-37 threonylcarbamoyl transferase component Bud32
MELNLSAPTEMPGDPGSHSAAATKPLPALEDVARHFPQFELLECLGRGGMGVVYKARQPKLNRIVALKILAPEKVAEPTFAERFLREAQALARLNHPNIVTVYDFGEVDGLYYLLMEFVDGMNLRELIRTQKLAPEQALAIVPKICDALQFAHEQGVVHRDIKPENVLLDKLGRVKIADFGIAKIVAGESGAPGTASPVALTQDQVLGTPNYMAPEQVEHPQRVDHRADIYSLGVVFYEMLTGELPLGKFAPPSKKVQVDVRLDEVVLHALEKEPERRYQQASEVKTAVETIAGTAGPNPPSAQASIPAGAPPPFPFAPEQQTYPVRFTADSVRNQFIFLALGWWIGQPLMIIADLLPKKAGLLLSIIYLPPLIVETVFWCILLYRHWLLLQGHGARTTPGKAVGFGFIPFFFFYWWFVAYAGLATDNNRYLRQLGITSTRMSYGLAVAVCILWVLICTIGLIPVVGAVLDVPAMIIGFILVLQQRDCVLAMLQHRTASAQYERQPPGLS